MGSRACITGASSGIGRSLAVQLAAEGYDLLITGRRRERLENLAREVGENHGRAVEIMVGDLADPSEITRLAERLAGEDELSVLVHNAGYGHSTDFTATPRDELLAMGRVHMQCAVALVRAALEPLRRSATAPARRPGIILVSSMAAFAPLPGAAMYTASKAFLVWLGRALHPVCIDAGVRLQVLCPGFTHTDFHDRLDWSAERRRSRGIIRWMHADEVARRALRSLRGDRLARRVVFVPGWTNRLMLLLIRLMPHRLYLRISRVG